VCPRHLNPDEFNIPEVCFVVLVLRKHWRRLEKERWIMVYFKVSLQQLSGSLRRVTKRSGEMDRLHFHYFIVWIDCRIFKVLSPQLFENIRRVTRSQWYLEDVRPILKFYVYICLEISGLDLLRNRDGPSVTYFKIWAHFLVWEWEVRHKTIVMIIEQRIAEAMFLNCRRLPYYLSWDFWTWCLKEMDLMRFVSVAALELGTSPSDGGDLRTRVARVMFLL
jgi:hypothetical protein